jgi:hypothetical protein
MINKLTEKQIVDAFAKHQPHVELNLPLDPEKCIWFYFTMDELETQLQNLGVPGEPFDKAKYDAYVWQEKIILQRRAAWLEFGYLSDVHYVEVTK